MHCKQDHNDGMYGDFSCSPFYKSKGVKEFTLKGYPIKIKQTTCEDPLGNKETMQVPCLGAFHHPDVEKYGLEEMINCKQYYSEQQQYETKLEELYIEWAYSSLIILIVLIILYQMFKRIGYKVIFSKFCFIISFHWVFKLIINLRSGNWSFKTMSKSVTEVVQNDQEIVNRIVEDSSLDPVEMKIDDVLYK